MEKKYISLILVVLVVGLITATFLFFNSQSITGSVVKDFKDKENKLPTGCIQIEERIFCKLASNIAVNSGEISELDLNNKKPKKEK